MRDVPRFVTLSEIRAAVYTQFPGAATIRWVDDAIVELYHNGAPDPNPRNEGRRLILPSQWGQFAKWSRNEWERN